MIDEVIFFTMIPFHYQCMIDIPLIIGTLMVFGQFRVNNLEKHQLLTAAYPEVPMY